MAKVYVTNSNALKRLSTMIAANDTPKTHAAMAVIRCGIDKSAWTPM